MSTSQEYTISRKVSDTEEEIIQIPYDALANKPDLSVYQTKNDASLKTNDKTVVGAINEVVTGVAETLESFGMSLAPQENGKLNNKVYVYPDGYLSQGTSYDASKDLYLSIGDGLTLETIDEANNIWNIKSGSVITSVDGLGGGAISGDVSTSGNLTVGGRLTVNGTTTTVDSTTLQVKDKLIEVAHGNTTKLTTPAGLVAPKYDGTNSGALVFDSTGTAYVGDVKLDSTGNIDVAKSELQPLATRTGLVGGNLVQYDSSALTLKDSGKKISDLATTSQVNAKYTKPSGGIPKTDLASDVQTSLGKADNAVQSFEAEATIDDTTGTPTVEVVKSGEGTAPTYTFNFKHLKGADGQQGEAGADGNHITVSTFNHKFISMEIIQVGGTYRDVNDWFFVLGTYTGDDNKTYQQLAGCKVIEKGSTTSKARVMSILDLPLPKDGADGKDGAQGIGVKSITSGTPTIVNDKTNTPITITLTDNTTVDLVVSAENGKDGTSATVTIVQATGQSTTAVMSQKAVTDELNKKASTSEVNAKYTKPSGGIPKSDLAEDVQTSLDKADTALQSAPVTSVNGKTGAVQLGASDVNALSLDGGTIKKSKTIKMDASSNSNGANLKWGTVNSKNPYIGYASDQVDGTFVVGSLLGTNYASGLAIGGGSGNLLWKGTKVATTSDIPNIVQSTGTSTSSVMSQNATTNAISGKLDKTTYEVNKTINFGRDGALYIGKFKVYDTNVTCEVTSTTSVTYSGKLVIATQNYVIKETTVYGDAANTVAPNIYIKPSSESDPYIEVYFKPESWSKNIIHIYGSEIKAEPTDVCTSIPAVPSTATIKPKNALPIYSLSGTTLTITL